MSSLLNFDLCFLSVNFCNIILFKQPVSKRQQSVLPLSLVSITITITQMSEKRCWELVFTSCFNFLKSKVNLEGVQTYLARRLFFFACDTILCGTGVEVEHHFFIALVVLFVFSYNCVFLHCRHCCLSHCCSCLPLQEIYRTFVHHCLSLWSISVFDSCSGLLLHCQNHLLLPQLLFEL